MVGASLDRKPDLLRPQLDRPREESKGLPVRCPFCRFPDSRVIDSREVDDGQAIRRRRSCPECSRRFTTVEESILAVVKRSGVTEPFSRAKVVVGVRRACQGRPVGEDALALLSQQVEEVIRAKGTAEVSSHEVGLAILGPLRDLDEVAYLRFASVYRSFDTVDDFAAEIARLRNDKAGDPDSLGKPSDQPATDQPGPDHPDADESNPAVPRPRPRSAIGAGVTGNEDESATALF